MVAQDGFLPRPFAFAGRRLVFSVGILYLAVTAGGLLIIFCGITEQLIPLFAIGAFLTFTLSQVGMVVHWRRAISRRARSDHVNRTHLYVNALGALTTAIALVIIVFAKFKQGAWITVLAIPAVIFLLKSIRRYYHEVAARVHEPSPLKLTHTQAPVVLVTIEEWNQLAERSMALALSLSKDVIGLHLAKLAGPEADEHQRRLSTRWESHVVEPARRAGLNPPPLVVLEAQYRAIHVPILRLARELEEKYPNRAIAVLVPELVKQRWYQRLLHTHRAQRLRSMLLEHGGSRLTIINVPWYLHEEDLQAQEPHACS
jgi:hypothetical protein